MIPLTVAEEIKETLLDYLLTTFNFQDRTVEQALRRFLTTEKTGLFKGPYLNLRLPYRPVDPAEPLPLDIRSPFIPHLHQFQSFQRLTSHSDHMPQPTLITTGTGSGKTECFLYPILDHCYRHRRQPGIKAIILYPMNALAADQAGRLADILWRDSRLKNQVTAGMYVGGNGQTHEDYSPGLSKAGISQLYLQSDTDEAEGSGVRLATMHRVKGLEFNHILISGVNAEYLPLRYLLSDDEGDQAKIALRDRCLLHVAATRARDSLTITSFGMPSEFLSKEA